MVRGPGGTGETLGETVWGVGVRRNGRECAQCFPCPLRHRGACWAPGPNPRSLPPAAQSPSPTSTPPPRAPPLHSETPSNTLGLNTTHTPSFRDLPPNSGTPHPRGPPFHVLPLPSCAGPKQRRCPMLEHSPA